jgi:uncharacterized protein (TIGR02996 family)
MYEGLPNQTLQQTAGHDSFLGVRSSPVPAAAELYRSASGGGMSSEDLAFLEAIACAPADDVRRLIYADWLDERGDPRGPFIRAQVELARLPPNHLDRTRLARLQEDLSPPARDAYRRAVPTEIASFFESGWVSDYRRGSLTKVTVFAEQVDTFATQASVLFRYAPIDEIEFEPQGLLSSGGDTTLLRTPTAVIQRFLQVPQLERLGALILNGPFEDPDGVARLVATCATLAGLRRLEFGERYGELERELRPCMSPSSRREVSERFGSRVSWRESECAEPVYGPMSPEAWRKRRDPEVPG